MLYKMRINTDNIVLLPESDRNLIKALLMDINEINTFISDKIYLDWQDYHNEYSH